MGSAPKTLGMLGLLTAALPANLALTGVALLRGRRSQPAVPAAPRTVLITGGKMSKALQLARSFHRAGHRVVLVESARYRLTGHRFSRAVSAFHVVPHETDPAYPGALATVAEREGVDLFVPVSSPAGSLPDARAGELLAQAGCDVVTLPVEVLETVDDKHAFCTLAASLGLDAPAVHRITDPQQLLDFPWDEEPGPWVAKSIAYDPVRRLDLTHLPLPTPEETAAYVATLPISPENPWVLQAWVEGPEHCTHGTVRDGHLQVHVCCASSASQLNYAALDVPEIEAWVERFAAATGLTGQISLDFIQGPDGRHRVIECNPRTHSAITAFHDHPGLAVAFAQDGAARVTPLPGSRPTYWLYHELWRALRHPRTAPAVARTLAEGTDAVFAWEDPLPFLLLHHLQLPALLVGNLLRGGTWTKIDVNIGKLVEPGGD